MIIEPEFKLRQIAPAVIWLRDHDLPAEQIAAIFGATAGNVRVALSRMRNAAQLRVEAPADSLADLFSRPGALLRNLRNIRGEFEIRRRKRPRISTKQFEAEIGDIRSLNENTSDFLSGAKDLIQLGYRIGHTGQEPHLRVVGKLYQNLAWFLGHSGRSLSAYRAARRAIDLYDLVYRTSDDPHDLKQLADTFLIASNSLLIARNPTLALRFLDLFREAFEKLRAEPGSEYHRQMAVARFQTGEGDMGQASFIRAVEMMEKKQEADRDVQLLLTGDRHSALIRYDWERAQAVCEAVNREYFANRIERAMAVNWAVATGLSIESTRVNLAALDLLERAPDISRRLSHQRTVAQLLPLALNVPSRLRPGFVRVALYTDAASRK